MALRDIRLDGDPVLRKRAREVDMFNQHLSDLLDDMAETMYHAEGVGLAAPQIGVKRRVIVVDIGDENLLSLVNPVIVSSEGQQCGAEGCLSIPGKSGYVRRPQNLVVEAQDREGNPLHIEAEGFLAVALCHEIDHLDGILFTDNIVEPTEEELRAMGIGGDDSDMEDEQEESDEELDAAEEI